jgi:hypothetical protein
VHALLAGGHDSQRGTTWMIRACGGESHPRWPAATSEHVSYDLASPAGLATGRLGEQCGVAVQVQRPSLRAGDAGGDRRPARAVPVDVAVLEFYAGAVRGFGDEADLDLAGVVRVGFDLPLLLMSQLNTTRPGGS